MGFTLKADIILFIQLSGYSMILPRVIYPSECLEAGLFSMVRVSGRHAVHCKLIITPRKYEHNLKTGSLARFKFYYGNGGMYCSSPVGV